MTSAYVVQSATVFLRKNNSEEGSFDVGNCLIYLSKAFEDPQTCIGNEIHVVRGAPPGFTFRCVFTTAPDVSQL